MTLGCPKNEVDSDVMAARASAAGYRIVEDTNDADVVIVNTCSFIQDATEESISIVLDLASPECAGDPRVVVAGCMPSRYGADLREALPEVAAFLPVADEANVVDVLDSLTGHRSTRDDAIPLRTVAGPSAYLRVSDGCHRTCAYCTIPAIRGPYRSVPLPELAREATALVASGAKELVLIGQDTTAWGRDLEGPETLADLITELSAIDGLEWLRIMYAQPDGVTEPLLRAMSASPKVCHYLDMPLQHASAPVLRAMKRRGDAESFRALVSRIRAVMPDVVLRTTLIAGFPGETREDALALKRFVEHVRFDYTGVFAYSPEDGTTAAAMPGQVPVRTKRARAQRLRDLADGIGTGKAASRVGETLEVLVEGVDPDEGVVFGRWRGQAPEIDGVVLLDRGEPGELVKVRIVDALGYDLEGEVV